MGKVSAVMAVAIHRSSESNGARTSKPPAVFPRSWLSPYTEVVKATSKNLETTCGVSAVMAVAIHRSSESNQQEPRNHLRCFRGHGCRHTQKSSESNEQEPRNHLRCFRGHGCRHTQK